MKLSPSIYKRILHFQRDEITGSILYEKIGKRQKNGNNKSTLFELAKVERSHYETWRSYTERDVKPNWSKIYLFYVISRILGDTFAFKFFELGEEYGIKELNSIVKEIPEAREINAEESVLMKRLHQRMQNEWNVSSVMK